MCHCHERIGKDDAEVEVCKAKPREAGEKACYLIQKIIISKDQDFATHSNYTKRILYILRLPYLLSFYPSGKKIPSQRLYHTCQNKRMFLHVSLINQLLLLQEMQY